MEPNSVLDCGCTVHAQTIALTDDSGIDQIVACPQCGMQKSRRLTYIHEQGYVPTEWKLDYAGTNKVAGAKVPDNGTERENIEGSGGKPQGRGRLH